MLYFLFFLLCVQVFAKEQFLFFDHGMIGVETHSVRIQNFKKDFDQVIPVYHEILKFELVKDTLVLCLEKNHLMMIPIDSPEDIKDTIDTTCPLDRLLLEQSYFPLGEIEYTNLPTNMKGDVQVQEPRMVLSSLVGVENMELQIYQRSASTFVLQHKLPVPEKLDPDWYGMSIGIDVQGTYIATMSEKNHLFYYHDQGNSKWLTCEYDFTGVEDTDILSYNVKVGANGVGIVYFTNSMSIDAGDTFYFTSYHTDSDDCTFDDTVKLKAPEASAFFGLRVEIIEHFILVAAPNANKQGENSGAIYIFDANEQKLVNTITTKDFGIEALEVSIGGDLSYDSDSKLLFVGAYVNDPYFLYCDASKLPALTCKKQVFDQKYLDQYEMIGSEGVIGPYQVGKEKKTLFVLRAEDVGKPFVVAAFEKDVAEPEIYELKTPTNLWNSMMYSPYETVIWTGLMADQGTVIESLRNTNPDQPTAAPTTPWPTPEPTPAPTSLVPTEAPTAAPTAAPTYVYDIFKTHDILDSNDYLYSFDTQYARMVVGDLEKNNIQFYIWSGTNWIKDSISFGTNQVKSVHFTGVNEFVSYYNAPSTNVDVYYIDQGKWERCTYKVNLNDQENVTLSGTSNYVDKLGSVMVISEQQEKILVYEFTAPCTFKLLKTIQHQGTNLLLKDGFLFAQASNSVSIFKVSGTNIDDTPMFVIDPTKLGKPAFSIGKQMSYLDKKLFLTGNNYYIECDYTTTWTCKVHDRPGTLDVQYTNFGNDFVVQSNHYIGGGKQLITTMISAKYKYDTFFTGTALIVYDDYKFINEPQIYHIQYDSCIATHDSDTQFQLLFEHANGNAIVHFNNQIMTPVPTPAPTTPYPTAAPTTLKPTPAPTSAPTPPTPAPTQPAPYEVFRNPHWMFENEQVNVMDTLNELLVTGNDQNTIIYEWSADMEDWHQVTKFDIPSLQLFIVDARTVVSITDDTLIVYEKRYSDDIWTKGCFVDASIKSSTVDQNLRMNLFSYIVYSPFPLIFVTTTKGIQAFTFTQILGECTLKLKHTTALESPSFGSNVLVYKASNLVVSSPLTNQVSIFEADSLGTLSKPIRCNCKDYMTTEGGVCGLSLAILGDTLYISLGDLENAYLTYDFNKKTFEKVSFDTTLTTQYKNLGSHVITSTQFITSNRGHIQSHIFTGIQKSDNTLVVVHYDNLGAIVTPKIYPFDQFEQVKRLSTGSRQLYVLDGNGQVVGYDNFFGTKAPTAAPTPAPTAKPVQYTVFKTPQLIFPSVNQIRHVHAKDDYLLIESDKLYVYHWSDFGKWEVNTPLEANLQSLVVDDRHLLALQSTKMMMYIRNESRSGSGSGSGSKWEVLCSVDVSVSEEYNDIDYKPKLMDYAYYDKIASGVVVTTTKGIQSYEYKEVIGERDEITSCIFQLADTLPLAEPGFGAYLHLEKGYVVIGSPLADNQAGKIYSYGIMGGKFEKLLSATFHCNSVTTKSNANCGRSLGIINKKLYANLGVLENAYLVCDITGQEIAHCARKAFHPNVVATYTQLGANVATGLYYTSDYQKVNAILFTGISQSDPTKMVVLTYDDYQALDNPIQTMVTIENGAQVYDLVSGTNELYVLNSKSGSLPKGVNALDSYTPTRGPTKAPTPYPTMTPAPTTPAPTVPPTKSYEIFDKSDQQLSDTGVQKIAMHGNLQLLDISNIPEILRIRRWNEITNEWDNDSVDMKAGDGVSFILDDKRFLRSTTDHIIYRYIKRDDWVKECPYQVVYSVDESVQQSVQSVQQSEQAQQRVNEEDFSTQVGSLVYLYPLVAYPITKGSGLSKTAEIQILKFIDDDSGGDKCQWSLQRTLSNPSTGTDFGNQMLFVEGLGTYYNLTFFVASERMSGSAGNVWIYPVKNHDITEKPIQISCGSFSKGDYSCGDTLAYQDHHLYISLRDSGYIDCVFDDNQEHWNCHREDFFDYLKDKYGNLGKYLMTGTFRTNEKEEEQEASHNVNALVFLVTNNQDENKYAALIYDDYHYTVTPLEYEYSIEKKSGIHDIGSFAVANHRELQIVGTAFTQQGYHRFQTFFGQLAPTESPTAAPTPAPTDGPTAAPTAAPTHPPTRYNPYDGGFIAYRDLDPSGFAALASDGANLVLTSLKDGVVSEMDFYLYKNQQWKPGPNEYPVSGIDDVNFFGTTLVLQGSYLLTLSAPNAVLMFEQISDMKWKRCRFELPIQSEVETQSQTESQAESQAQAIPNQYSQISLDLDQNQNLAIGVRNVVLTYQYTGDCTFTNPRQIKVANKHVAIYGNRVAVSLVDENAVVIYYRGEEEYRIDPGMMHLENYDIGTSLDMDEGVLLIGTVLKKGKVDTEMIIKCTFNHTETQSDWECTQLFSSESQDSYTLMGMDVAITKNSDFNMYITSAWKNQDTISLMMFNEDEYLYKPMIIDSDVAAGDHPWFSVGTFEVYISKFTDITPSSSFVHTLRSLYNYRAADHELAVLHHGATPTEAPTPKPTTAPSSSSAAIIGIVIGILVVALFGTWVYHRKRNETHSQTQTKPMNKSKSTKKML